MSNQPSFNGKKVLVIGVGGVGINTVSKLMVANHSANYFENSDFLTIDGSSSNTAIFLKALQDIGAVDKDPNVLDKKHWVVPNGQGAGAIRGSNVQPFLDFIASKFKEIPKADIYIVAYSTGGGSGSVLGPELSKLLAKSGRNVVNNILVNTDSANAYKNANNVIRGLAANAKLAGAAINAFVTMDSGISYSEADELMIEDMIAAGVALGNDHQHLDISDIKSFLSSHLFGVPPLFNRLVRTYNVDEVNNASEALGVLSLTKSIDESVPNVKVLTNTRGIAPAHQSNEYFYTTNRELVDIRQAIEKQLKLYQDLTSNLAERDVLQDSPEEMEY